MGGCDFLTYFSGPGGFFAGGMAPFLVWGLVIVFLVYLAVKLFGGMTTSRAGGKKDKDDSLEILNMRFARGEISREEYLKMRELLGQSLGG
jgi:putative membrane protein